MALDLSKFDDDLRYATNDAPQTITHEIIGTVLCIASSTGLADELLMEGFANDQEYTFYLSTNNYSGTFTVGDTVTYDGETIRIKKIIKDFDGYGIRLMCSEEEG